MAELFTEVVTSGCARVRRLCRRLPLRRPRLQRPGRGLQAVPRRRRRRSRQLHTRPEGCTLCTRAARASAPGSPKSRRTGSAGPGQTTRWPVSRAAPSWPGPPIRRCRHRAGRWAGVGPPDLGFRARGHRRSAVSGLEGDGSTWKAVPQVAARRRMSWPRPVLATPTRPIPGLRRGDRRRGERIALVGMGCQASAPP